MINEIEENEELLNEIISNLKEEPQEHKIPEKLTESNYLNNTNFEEVDSDLFFIINKINEIINYLKEIK